VCSSPLGPSLSSTLGPSLVCTLRSSLSPFPFPSISLSLPPFHTPYTHKHTLVHIGFGFVFTGTYDARENESVYSVTPLFLSFSSLLSFSLFLSLSFLLSFPLLLSLARARASARVRVLFESFSLPHTLAHTPYME